MSEQDPFQALLDSKTERKPKADSLEVRRVALPGGRTIEVVNMNEAREKEQGLHICPDCDSDHVQPTDWSETQDARWHLSLCCPNCFWETEGVYTEGEVNAFEETLDAGLDDMIASLQHVTQFLMAEEVERFSSALNDNHILPEDF